MNFLPFDLILTVGTAIAVFVLGCFIWFRAKGSTGSLTFGLLSICLALWTSADWFLHLQPHLLPTQALLWKLLFYLSVCFAPALALRIAAHVAGHVRLKASVITYVLALMSYVCLGGGFVLRELYFSNDAVSFLFRVGSAVGLLLYIGVGILIGSVLYPVLWTSPGMALLQRRASYAAVILLPFLFAGALQLLSGPIPTGLFMPILCGLFIFVSLIAFLRSSFLEIQLGSLEAFFIPLLSFSLVVLLRSRDVGEFLVSLLVCFAIGVYGVLAIQSLESERSRRLSSEETTRQLRRLEEARRDFVDMVAHQLRTPLGGIRGMASMLEEGDFGKLPERAVVASREIGSLAERLLSMSETFLNASRVDVGAFTSQRSRVVLTEVFDGIRREVEIPAKTKGLKIFFSLDPQAPSTYEIDADVLQNALFNLVDNAVKYTAHGSVHVEAAFGEGLLRISVTDTGQGMGSQELHGLFQKFHRGKTAREADQSGTGLGLYVVRQLVEAAGGRVSAESEGLGKGSTFRLSLPARPIDGGAA